MPYPFLICWLIVLIAGIVLFPLRAERTDDVINSWLPYGGQARLSRDFVADLWKHQAAVAKYPDLVDRVEGLGYDVNDDAFFRLNRKYFIIWAADKSWDYAEDSNGPSIQTKAHYEEWYNFNKKLWTDSYLVDGVNRSYADVCQSNYATNAWHVGDHLKATRTDALSQMGMLLFEGFANGKFNAAAATGTEGLLWDTLINKYVDDRSTNPTDYAHNTMHSQAIIGFTAEGLAGQLSAILGYAPCAHDAQTECIRQFQDAVDGDPSTLVTQYNYNYNCKSLVDGLSPDLLPLFDSMTPNEITTLCSNFLFYSSIDGVSEYENMCGIGDWTFCVQEGLTTFYGTLFSELFIGAALPYWQDLPKESDFTNDSISDADFMAKKSLCGTDAFLTSNNGRYIRSSKFMAQPVQLARRIQIQNGECTLHAPDTALSELMWDAIAYSEEVQAMENGVGMPAWDQLGACQEFAKASEYNGMIANATAFGDTAAAARWTTTLTDSGYDLTALTGLCCSASFMDCAVNPPVQDALQFGLVSLNFSDAVTAVGTGAALWSTWYKSQIYYDCGEYTDDAITTAMSYREIVQDQITQKVEEFNENSVYLKASVLSNKTEKEGYAHLYDQNIVLIISALVIFLVLVTIIQWNFKEVAIIGIVLILCCVVAVFGFMPPPYTPSVLQFLPYLCLGIGVDDLFVVLHHYRDEDNISRALHHSGPTITMTSLVNLLAFVCLCLISNVPDFRIFTTAAAIAIVLLYGNIFLGIVPIMFMLEKCKGIEDDPSRPGDDFVDEEDLEKTIRTLTTQLGQKGLQNYRRYKDFLEPFKCIGTLLVIIGLFITMVILSVLKIQGIGFEEIDFGLQLSQLVYESSGDHAFRSIMILERFPLYSIECGANKNWGEDTYKGMLYDDYAHEYIPYFQGFANLQDTSYNPVNWIGYQSAAAGRQPYPFYTNAARSPPPLQPSAWAYWYDWDHAQQTNLTVPESTIYIRPTAADSRGIVPGRDITKAVDRLYDYLDDFKDIGAYCTANILEVYERYITVEDTLLKGLLVSAVIVFVVGVIMLQDIGATLILTFTTMATAFELWGFYGFATLRINSFLTLCITLGAAFTVQYTAHVNRRFVKSKASSRWYRMVDALSCYTAPIVYGGVTTAVAVSAAGFLPAKYFRLYFFYSFLIMVAFGLFNGLLVQSALLVLIPINPTAWNQPMFGEPEDDEVAQRRYSAAFADDNVSGSRFPESSDKGGVQMTAAE